MPRKAPARVVSLLAYLIAHRDRRPTRAAVATALWPDELEDDARANLRRHLHLLNAELPKIAGSAWIEATTTALRWNEAAPAWIDVVEFARNVAAGKAAAAAELYGGEFLEGHYDDWVIAERERLLATFLEVTYELAVRARSERDFALACEHADRMLAFGEWREDALRVKIAALYEMGDRPGSLAAFDAFAKELRDEMSVDVMPETRALRDAIVANLPLTAEAPPARSAIAQSAMVGRAAELDRLLAMWQVAARRTGTTVFLGGEGGIGKSRLLAEFAATVELQGGHALFGYAREGEGAPYQPLVDVVRAAAPYLQRDELPDVWLAALTPLVPELLRLHPDLPELPGIDSGKQRLHEAFARVLESLARRRPVAVILEDVHWANDDTLDALEHLARRAGSSHVMLLASYRPEEASPDHPLRRLRRALQSEHRAAVVSLGPLDRESIGALVASAAPAAADAQALADAIFEASEGHPLFAWQLLQGFIETGAVSFDGIALDQAIAARAARLEPRTRSVLDVASLVGDRFTVEELAEIGAWNEGDVFDSVDELLDLRLLRYAAPGLDLTFAHRLIRDAVASIVPAQGRSALHRRIAAVLDRTRDADGLLVATHHALAGDRKAAFEGFLSASDAAQSIYAHAEAFDRASRASDFAATDEERFRAGIAMLETLKWTGRRREWQRALSLAEKAATTLGDDERFEALRRRCRYEDVVGSREAGREAVSRLIDFAESTRRPEHRMTALHEKGRLDVQQGRLAEGVRALEAALEFAPSGERLDVKIQVLSVLVHGLMRLGRIAEGIAALERAKALLEDGDVELQSELLTAELAVALVLEDEAAYRKTGEFHLKACEELGSPSGIGLALAALAQAALIRGDVAESRRRYREALATFERHNLVSNLLSNLINCGVMEREAGNLDEALALWERAWPLAEKQGAKTSLACISINIGEALLARGDIAGAQMRLRNGVELCEAIGEPRLLCDAQVALGAVRARSGDVDAGITLIRTAIAKRQELRATRSLASDHCTLIEELLDARRTSEAVEAASELRKLYDAAPEGQMYPTRLLAALARAARAQGEDEAARRFATVGKALFEARMASLPDDQTRAQYAQLAFNREYAATP